ncbi:MAG: LacI family DNA-binding transcriptional regulator [Eubacteriales bacterium]|nr:LacI family DNA-binding transcriptional regulator [Eubacteriales bacterium]
MVTIKDVASAVGVSPTTVSNVIRGNAGRVSPEMIERINKAIEELGYTPNLSARALVSSSSHIIGVINHLVPSESGGFFQDPFHGALLSGIEETLRQKGYYMMMRTIDSCADLMSLLNNWNLDGLILTGIFPSEFFTQLLRQDTPFLLVDSYVLDEVPQVRLEDRTGGYLGVKHLLEMGHRRILFCGPPIYEHGVLRERYKGYCDALQEYGLSPCREDVYGVEIGVDRSAALGRELAKRRDYTAIFATADILAAGLISGLNDEGRHVPEDISVVGFDDLNIARLTSPQLTTVHQDVTLRGCAAADMLIAHIENKQEAVHTITMPVRLVERQSVKRLS